MILALFVSAVLHPVKDQLNSISEHYHSIASRISELRKSNMSYSKSWDCTGQGSDGEENGAWE